MNVWELNSLVLLRLISLMDNLEIILVIRLFMQGAWQREHYI